MALLDHRAEEIASAFEMADVDFVVLKGPAVRALLYDASERRAYSDVDLLIDPRKVEEAAEALSGLGFRPRFAGADAREREFYSVEWALGAVIADVHSTYPGFAVDAHSAWAILAALRTDLFLRTRHVPILNAPGVAMIVALHAAKSVGRNGPNDPDLVRAVQRLDVAVWRQTAALARQLGAGGALRGGLELASPVLVAQLGLSEPIPTQFRLEADGAPPVAQGLERLARSEGTRGKLALVSRKLVPTPDGLRYWSPLARRGRVGLAAAYVVRPFWLLAKLPAAARAWRRARQSDR